MWPQKVLWKNHKKSFHTFNIACTMIKFEHSMYLGIIQLLFRKFFLFFCNFLTPSIFLKSPKTTNKMPTAYKSTWNAIWNIRSTIFKTPLYNKVSRFEPPIQKWPEIEPPIQKMTKSVPPYLNIPKIWTPLYKKGAKFDPSIKKLAKILPPLYKNGQNVAPLYKKRPKVGPPIQERPKFDPPIQKYIIPLYKMNFPL